MGSLGEMKYEHQKSVRELCDDESIPYIVFQMKYDNEGKKIMNTPFGWKTWNYDECLKENDSRLYSQKCDAMTINLKKSKYMIIDNDKRENIQKFNKAYGSCWTSFSYKKGLQHKWFMKQENDASLTKTKAYDEDEDGMKGIDLLYDQVIERIDSILYYNTEIDDFPFLVSHPKPKDKNEVKEKPKQSISIIGASKNKTKDIKEIELMLDLGLLNGKANDKYDDWLNVAMSMKRSGASYELFDEFSRIDTRKYDEDKNKEIWDKLDISKDGYNIGSLKNWCKEYNKELYDKYFNYYLDAEVLEGEAFKIQEHIKEKLRNLVYVEDEKTWIQYNDNECIWERKADPTHYVLSVLVRHIDCSIAYLAKKVEDCGDEKESEKDKKKLKGQIECYKMYEKKFNSCGFTSQFIKLLKTSLCDNEFIKKLDRNPNKIAFKNGMLDLETGLFRNRLRYNDYLTGFIPKDYETSTEEEKKWVDDILFKICNCDKEQAEYYKSVLGFSLLGTPHKEKSIFGMVGEKANNGKTTILASLEKIASCYVRKMSNEALMKHSTKAHKHLVCFEKARIVYCEEIPNKKINTDLLKELGDGKEIQNEVMFGTSRSIVLCGKLFMISQKPMDFATDKGIITRYKQLQFNSQFLKEDHDDYHLIDNKTIFKADKTLCDKLEGEYAMAFLNVLFEYSQMYLKEKQLKKIPAFFAEKTRETLKKNDVISEWWEEHIEIGDDYKLAKEEVDKKRGGIPLKELVDFIKSKGFEYNKELTKSGYKKGGWRGFRLIEVSQEE